MVLGIKAKPLYKYIYRIPCETMGQNIVQPEVYFNILFLKDYQ